MCDYCRKIELTKDITSPAHYEKILSYIQDLIDKEGYLLVDGNCELKKPKNENGCWVDDIIFHTIQCPKCNQKFTCIVNTYRGGGSFMKSGEE